MVTACLQKDGTQPNSVKQNKAKADVIQSMKVSLEAQTEMLQQERLKMEQTYQSVSWKSGS